MSKRTTQWMAAVLLGALMPSVAQADPCSNLTNPVYFSAGSIFEPVLRRVSPLLAAATGDDRMTPVFIFTQSCDSVRRLAENTPLTGNGRFYGADGMATQCEIPTGTLPDLAIGDLFPQTCTMITPGLDVSMLQNTPTMVVPMTLAVPVASDQFAIAAEEGYFAYGFGMAGMVAPWTDETVLFRRTQTSGTQWVISQGINVPTARWRGVDGMNTQTLLMRLAAVMNPRQALGILGGNEADANRMAIRVLAFRAYGQNNFYWPDGRRASFDKRNVRDGHYPLWAYQNAFVRSDSPMNSRGRRFIDFLATNISPRRDEHLSL
jgi:hypothetical protein